jgi:transcriptional regulator with XRE-family HTH domain
MFQETEESRRARGRKFRAATIKAGYSAKDLADAIGCHVNTIYVWFKNPNDIRLSQLDKMITILRVPKRELYETFFPEYERLKLEDNA